MSPPERKANIDVPHVTSTKTKTTVPRVNLNAAQFSKFGKGNPFPSQPYESAIPEKFTQPPGKQIIRMDDEFNPSKEFYFSQLIGLQELPTRTKDIYLIPEMLNQNIFLASPLNSRGYMQSTTLFDTNLLITGQMF